MPTSWQQFSIQCKMRTVAAALLIIVQAAIVTAFVIPPTLTAQSTTYSGVSSSSSSLLLLSSSSSPLQAIPGVAKDAEEDLLLTIKVILAHAERTDKNSTTSTFSNTDQSATTKITDTVLDVSIPYDAAARNAFEAAGSKGDYEAFKTQFEADAVADVMAKRQKLANSKEKETSKPEKPIQVEKKKAVEAETKISLPDVEINRQFRFVGEGEAFSESPSISCDGRIPGVTLELTHWNGNETPDELYADTSTEMALKLATNIKYANNLKDAWVLNNHYDTDGVLSVWACLEPEQAMRHKDLMIAAAEAGDFGEWNSDQGVKLDICFQEIRKKFNGDGVAFVVTLQDYLPDLLEDMSITGGQKYGELWRPAFFKVNKSWESFVENKTKISSFNDDIVIVERSWMVPPVEPYALHRALKEKGLDKSTKRVLHVLRDAKGARFKYQQVGHGWVHKLVQRIPVPDVDGKKLIEELRSEYEDSNWKKVDESLSDICESVNITETSVEEIAEYLASHDSGLISAQKSCFTF